MVKILTTIALLAGILGAATAKDCPSDRFSDCCANYGTATPDTMKNTFHVPDHRIPQTGVPVGYVCMGSWGCEVHGLEARCCKDTWKSWGGAGRLGIDCV
ncbi:hypothetical protein BKA61DRAFT_668515 [Leptodontidium sp. MPI-SDFR-AT-0119]|nr:hypothetical protein BKA61DRAFT_668515 [Leptodontidium sp. MPI-SDFR-AT-0119]